MEGGKESDKYMREVLNKNREPRNGIVSCPLLNVRTKPNFNSEVLTIISQGESVKIFSVSDGWARIRTNSGNGIMGFVRIELLGEA